MPERAPIRLLIVHDQESIRELCAAIGSRIGLRCTQCESVAEAVSRMEGEAGELVLADLEMDGGRGQELLREVKRRWPQTEVVLMGPYGSPESTGQATRLGAYDFIAKPFRVEDCQRVLERMAEKTRLVRENELLRLRLADPGPTMAPAVERLATKAAGAPEVALFGDGIGQSDARLFGESPDERCTDLEELERITVRRVFDQVDGDKEQAQKLLGISRATLYRMIKRYGIETRTARQRSLKAGDSEVEEQFADLSRGGQK